MPLPARRAAAAPHPQAHGREALQVRRVPQDLCAAAPPDGMQQGCGRRLPRAPCGCLCCASAAHLALPTSLWPPPLRASPLPGARLQSHMLTHTGEKPFECDECHRTFAQSGTLTVRRENCCARHPCAACPLLTGASRRSPAASAARTAPARPTLVVEAHAQPAPLGMTRVE